MLGIILFVLTYLYYPNINKDKNVKKQLLEKKGLSFTDIDVAGKPELRQQMIKKAAGASSVPQIWIGDTHVGGCDELYACARAGQLDELLAG